MFNFKKNRYYKRIFIILVYIFVLSLIALLISGINSFTYLIGFLIGFLNGLILFFLNYCLINKWLTKKHKRISSFFIVFFKTFLWTSFLCLIICGIIVWNKQNSTINNFWIYVNGKANLFLFIYGYTLIPFSIVLENFLQLIKEKIILTKERRLFK